MSTIKGRLVPNSNQLAEEKLPPLSEAYLFKGVMATHASHNSLVYFKLIYPGPYSVYTKTSEFRALVNPESFSESIEPQYSKRPVIGLSHEVIQYIRTGSRSISMDLFVSWFIMQQKGYIDLNTNPLQWRNRFEAMVLPSGPYYGPPQVRVEWPGAYLDFIGVCTGLDIDYQRFSSAGEPLEYSIKTTFVEVNGASGLMTSQAAYRRGIGRNATLGLKSNS